MYASKKSTSPTVDALAYLKISPNSGPDYRFFTEEDIVAIGGVHAVERYLENDSYWFVYLGAIQGRLDGQGLTVSNSAIAKLPEPSENAWKTGRLNPAFGRSDFEKIAFRAAFEAIGRLLDSWKQEEDGIVDAYTLKELKISAQRLASLVIGLNNLKKVHEVLEITIIKFWYDPTWSGRHLPSGLDLAEYSLMIPVQFRWGEDEKILTVEVPPMSSC